MNRVVYSARALRDLERFSDFLREVDPSAAEDAVRTIVGAIHMLRGSPFVGRTTGRRGLRELVVSYGKTGYVVLYRLRNEQVEVIAMRHQRERSFKR